MEKTFRFRDEGRQVIAMLCREQPSLIISNGSAERIVSFAFLMKRPVPISPFPHGAAINR
jgi:hypothetical protein